MLAELSDAHKASIQRVPIGIYAINPSAKLRRKECRMQRSVAAHACRRVVSSLQRGLKRYGTSLDDLSLFE